MQRMVTALLTLTLASGLSTGCAKQRVGAEKALAMSSSPTSRRTKLGLQVKQELETKEQHQVRGGSGSRWST